MDHRQRILLMFQRGEELTIKAHSGRLTLPAPKSAKLPAVRDEIPPPSERLPRRAR